MKIQDNESLRKREIAMKTTAVIRALAGIMLAGVVPYVHAQSSVTLYGIVDTSLRYLTNANATNDSQLAMGVGPITGSRWGLKGSEDLGAGLQTIFRLENGFNLWNGQLASTIETSIIYDVTRAYPASSTPQ